ncbi:MAG TPA: hypothetical protein VF630_09055 [Hymenobacter sp.]|jgi:hypothetical protein
MNPDFRPVAPSVAPFSAAPPTPLSNKALTCCWVVWINGWKKKFYSFDTSGRYAVDDPRDYGIRGLKKMVAKMGATVDQAILYDNQSGKEIERLKNGQWVSPE